MRSKTEYVLLDGQPGSDGWYYAIGYTGTFPEWPNLPSINDKPGVNCVSLWVKVKIYKESCLNNYWLKCNTINYIFVIIS